MGAGSVAIGFVAGTLTTLSPCVLPVLPLLLAGATSAHRWGLAALTAGMVLSFLALGLFLATVGFTLGIDGDLVRVIAAIPLALLGVVLLVPALQARLTRLLAGIGDAGQRAAGRLAPSGLAGQFGVGLLLGAIWLPCVGPTLGAASLLAAQGKQLGGVAAVMAAFALGTALPLLAVGALSRAGLRRWRGRLLGAGQAGRRALGAAVLAVALLILTGTDRAVEARLVNASRPGSRN